MTGVQTCALPILTYTGFVDLDNNDLFNIVNVSTKPVLQLGELGSFDEFGTYPLSVIKENNFFRGYYAGWTRCESTPFNVGLGYAISTDNGRTFKKVYKGPIIPYTVDEPYVLSGPKIYKFNNKYYLFYISGRSWHRISGRYEISHRIRVAISDDGENWKKLNKNLIDTYWDKHESQSSPDVFFSGGKYHMFFCGWTPKFFRLTRNRVIGYASSSDLINWSREDSKAGISLSKDGWDNKMVAYPHVFNLKDNIYMLYIGNENGKYGFGLAKLHGILS